MRSDLAQFRDLLKEAKMAATVERIVTAPDIDVFTLPHSKMRKLMIDTAQEVTSTNFEDISSMRMLLQQLSTTLIQLRLHEEIEDKYIMKVLKKRLSGHMLKKLIKHLHANSHISELLAFVKNLQREIAVMTNEDSLKQYGEELDKALKVFYEEYLPHMIDEEKVFQPLLLNYFTYNELRDIKERVLKLHCIKDDETFILGNFVFDSEGFQDSKTKADQVAEIQEPEVNLPYEILLKIFKYLQPKDLCRCAQVSKFWSVVALDMNLWSVLHPSKWGRGDFTFGQQSSNDFNCDCEPNYNLLEYRDSDMDESTACDSEGEDAGSSEHIKESRILLGIARYLLPKIGKGVKTLVLECSKAITNGMLYRILSQCPNMEFLDVSQTIISDLGLNGLFKDGGGRRLKHLDLSGCVWITDKTLIKLASLYSKPSKSERGTKCSDCTCMKKQEDSSESSKYKSLQGLECLRLSGCYKITDVGLRALAKRGFPDLKHLDLSGCFNVSPDALKDLVSTCAVLDAEELYYCDNITEGPYAQLASGCQNVECKNRVCCRNIVMRQQVVE